MSLTTTASNDLQEALFTLVDCKDRYERAYAYYTGDQDEVFTSGAMRRALKAVGTDYRVNFASTVVDAVSNRLEVAGVQSSKMMNQSKLDNIWNHNQLSVESSDIHRAALTYGDSYVLAWPVDGEIETYLHTPLEAVILYDDEHPRVKKVAAKWWTVNPNSSNPTRRVNLYYADRVERYSTQSRNVTGRENWSLMDVVANPFGEIPMFHFRTHRPYGRPEHYAAFGAQDAINKLVVTQMNTVDYQGAPQRYALAGNNQSNEIVDFREGDTSRENLEALKNGPGELWYLKGIDKVGQFEPGNPDAFMKPLETYISAMASLTSTPLHYFDGGSYPSGESLRTAEAPLLKKIKDRKVAFTATWEEMLSFALRIDGVEDKVTLNWENHESMDEMVTWETAIKKKQAGLPQEQVFAELGYDADKIAEFMAIKEANKPVQEASPEDRDNLSTVDPSNNYNNEMSDGQ